MSRLAARVATGLTLAAVVLTLLWLGGRFAPGRVAFPVVTVLALAVVWEIDRMGSLRRHQFGRGLYPAALATAAVAGLVVFGVVTLEPARVLFVLYACAAAFSWPWVAIEKAPTLPPERSRLLLAHAALAFALWLLPPLFALVLVDMEFGISGLFALVFLAKIGDNAAYFVGRSIGKRHPFPNISPGKTVAGCVASLVAGIACGALVLPPTLGRQEWSQVGLGALFGGLINVAAQAGDLSKSWVKRKAGVKDSSALLGPSGGVLDVVDSLLFAAPLVLLAWTWAYPASSR